MKRKAIILLTLTLLLFGGCSVSKTYTFDNFLGEREFNKIVVRDGATGELIEKISDSKKIAEISNIFRSTGYKKINDSPSTDYKMYIDFSSSDGEVLKIIILSGKVDIDGKMYKTTKDTGTSNLYNNWFCDGIQIADKGTE